MKRNFILTLSAASVLAMTAASAEGLPDIGQRPQRQQSSMLPLTAPQPGSNPLLKQLSPFSTNALNPAPMRARREGEQAESPTIYGVVIGASSYTQYGIKKLPLNPGEDFTSVQGYGAYFNQVISGTETDGIFYANQLTERYGSLYCAYYNAIDINNWSRIGYTQSSDMIYAGRDLATDPTTGDMYGCFIKTSAGASYVLARVEYQINPLSQQYTSFKRDAVCDLPCMLTALFFDAQGQLYGIDMVTGNDEDGNVQTQSASLYKIDKATGELTLIGDTGAKPFYASSAVADIYGDGTVYWSVKTKDNVGSLYTVDLATGAATKRMDFPRNEQVVAMFVPMRAADEAPAAPEDVTADFPEGSLNGNIRFTVPTLLKNGEAAQGDAQWTVTLSGQVIGEGSVPVGTAVACPYTAAQAGNYDFSVRLANDAGKSAKVSCPVFIGTGTPASPAPTAVYENGKITVTWEAVTTAAYDRGYINPANIVYEVTRQPDNTVVAAGTKETSFVEDLGADAPFGWYKYSVVAIDGQTRSGAGNSNMVVAGTIVPPFTEEFSNTDLIGYGDNATKGVYPNYDLDGSTIGHWYVHGSDKAATCSTGFGDENSWLLTPAVRLEAGQSYTISFDSWTGYVPSDESKYSRLKVACGRTQTPEGMENTVIPEYTITDLKTDKGFTITDFAVFEDGVYYFGFQCCTKNGGAQVYIDNLTIEPSPEPGLPGQCTNMKVTPAATGSLDAVITMTAPVKDNRGRTLNGTVEVKLIHDGQTVATQAGVEPGATVSFNHTAAKGGETLYTAVCSNHLGEGRANSASAYLGYYAPRPAANVRLWRYDSTSQFKVEWTAPTQDTKWNDLQASDLSYKVLGLTEEGETYIIADNIDGSQSSVQFSDPSVDFSAPQRFVYYGVVALTNGGISSVTPSNILPVGQPYPAPYKESFSGTPAGIYCTSMSDALGVWDCLADDTLEGIQSQDGDNAYLGFFGNMWNVQGVFQTGTIDLTGLQHPGVTFYVYNIYQNNTFDDNEIFVAVNFGEATSYTLKAEADKTGNLGKANAWTKYTVSLAPFKNRKLSLMIVPTIKGYVWNFIDNLTVGELPQNDLSAGPVAGSPLIEEGQTGMYVFNVINNGYATAQNFTFDLLRNGRTVQTQTVASLEPGQIKQLTILDDPDVDADETAVYKGHAVIENDADPSDNYSDPIVTQIALPAYPVVETLVASGSEEGVTLGWRQPDLDYVPLPMTETFEKAEAWATTFEGWTFVDRDQSPINLGTANGYFGPIATGSAQSFFIMDVSELDEQRQSSIAFTGHSGLRYLMKCSPGNSAVAGDDWAISPELYGDAQTVSLWAHSHSSSSPENIELLYSTGSLDPDEFISLGKYIDVPTGWTMYSADLPAGAKRFAVRAHSQGTFLLQIDDITYQPVPLDLEVVGYHVWRNGLRLTSEPVKATEYTDAAGSDTDLYRVSTVYQVGESRPGNEVSLLSTGVDEASAQQLRIASAEGCIVVTGACGKTITVYAADGTIVGKVAGLESNAIPAGKGIYFVTVGNDTAKVMVK